MEETLGAVPVEIAVKYTRVGFECIRAGKTVEPKRWVEGPQHQLHLRDLRPLLRPDPLARAQLEKRRAELLAAAETTVPED